MHYLHEGKSKTSSIAPIADPITALLALQCKPQIAEIEHLSFLASVSSSLSYQSGALLFELKESFVGINELESKGRTWTHKEEQEKLAATREVMECIFAF